MSINKLSHIVLTLILDLLNSELGNTVKQNKMDIKHRNGFITQSKCVPLVSLLLMSFEKSRDIKYHMTMCHYADRMSQDIM